MQINLRRTSLFIPPMLLGSIGFCMLLWVVGQRWQYPYQIEWIEGSVLHHVVRIVEGQPLYVMPDMTYAPALYTPFYYYVSAAVSALFETGLPALRLVSILATALAFAAVGSIAWQLTRSRLACALAVLLAAVPFRFTGYWYDVARVDSLWACCLLLSIACLCRLQNTALTARWAAGAALLFTAAVMTKQTSLFLAPFLFITAWCWAGARAAWAATAASFIVLAVSIVFFQWQSNGLFLFFTMDMAGNHNMTRGFPFHFFKGDLLESMPVLLLLMGFFVQRAWAVSIRQGFGWCVLLLGIFAMTLLARMYAGGARNVTMPMHWTVVPLAVAGFTLLINRAPVLLASACSILLAANIVWSFYVPAWAVPSMADKAYGDALVQRIAAVSGRVCLSRDAYLGWMAGKGFCAHETQLTDILNGGDPALAEHVVRDAQARILSGYYDVIIVDSLFDIGNYVNVWNIPYIATPLDQDEESFKRFNPVCGGPRPHLWLKVVPDRTQAHPVY